MVDVSEEMVSSPRDLALCCDDLARYSCIGFDTEFVGEDSYHPHICLIQIATPDRLILIDPLTVGPLDAFWKLIIDPVRTVVVHAGREEIRLCRLWSGQAPGRLFDLQLAAGLIGPSYPLGHGHMVQQFLGVRLSKGETRTEWRDRPLTPQQIRYAFDDVRYLLPLWQQMSDRLKEMGRLSWAEEEFARLTAHADQEQTVLERWRKLRGLGSLDRRRLAMVRELSAWREEMAAQANRPARTIVRDDLLVEIARRNPTRERDLHVIRGLPHRNLAGIVEAVRRARELPLERCPELLERDQDPPQVGLVVNVLNAVLGDFCVRNQVAPSLVAAVQDVRQLVRARLQGLPLPADSCLTSGWRQGFVLPAVLDVLDGRSSLRIANLRSPTPFQIELEGKPAS